MTIAVDLGRKATKVTNKNHVSDLQIRVLDKLNFLISQSKHALWVLGTVSMRWFFLITQNKHLKGWTQKFCNFMLKFCGPMIC